MLTSNKESLQTLPKVSGDREAYKFYVETMLQFRCEDCQDEGRA